MSEKGQQAQHCCSICKKPVIAGEARYTVTENHYDCEFPNGVQSTGERFAEMDKQVDEVFEALGLKRKRIQSPLGQGGPTKKLIEILSVSAREHFETEDVADIKIYLAPPVWRQARFDVQRFEGSMQVRGRLELFGSWYTVSQLIKFRRVKFTSRGTDLELSPDQAQPRRRYEAE